MEFDIPNLLNLSVVPGIGSVRTRSLIAKFRSPEKVFNASISELVSVDGIDSKTAHNIKTYSDFQFGEAQYKTVRKLGAKIITFWDDDYPANLKKMYDPPVILFVKGAFHEQDKSAIAIVGTRVPSVYGKVTTEKITKQLAEKGLTIVSGLARGVDTIAHWTSLKASSRTIAVLGSGIDIIYPSENKKLAIEIATQGAIVSEFPLGTPPDAVNFPRRNRIIAGLSLGTVIVEAGEKSGALITANLALEYNREVFAVPGNITSVSSKGCNQLIKDGAKLVCSVNDIIEELLPQLKRTADKTKTVDKVENMTPLEKEILENLSDIPLHIDNLSRNLNKSPRDILSTLLSLEFKDMVKQLPGKYFVIME